MHDLLFVNVCRCCSRCNKERLIIYTSVPKLRSKRKTNGDAPDNVDAVSICAPGDTTSSSGVYGSM
jgi:hypothetical protein